MNQLEIKNARGGNWSNNWRNIKAKFIVWLIIGAWYLSENDSLTFCSILIIRLGPGKIFIYVYNKFNVSIDIALQGRKS